MKSLTWQQVNAWRLAQHSLVPRSERGALVEVVSRLYGVYAHSLSVAGLILNTRLDNFVVKDIETALWQERSLVRTWAMRGTTHLLTAEDLPLYIAARRLDPPRPVNFEALGLTARQTQAFLDFVPELLERGAISRENLALAVSAKLGLPILTELIGARWATLLKPLALRGELCPGPDSPRTIMFVNPKQWLNTWKSVDPDAAFAEIARRFIYMYGPTTPRHLARWWDISGMQQAKTVFEQLDDELESVEVEGWQGMALKSTVEQMQAMTVSGVVRLLPLLDPCMTDIRYTGNPLLPEPYRKRVFQKKGRGWIRMAVLVDGYVQGVWDYNPKETPLKLMVEMFESPAPHIQAGIEAEARHLGAFLKTPVVLEYQTIV